MLQPGRLTLAADRWTPFGATLLFKGIDLSAASFKAQVRLLPDAPGAPLIELLTVISASAQGIRLAGVATVDGQPESTVTMKINETTIEALPVAAELGDDLPLWWDMHVIIGGLKQRWLAGAFLVRAGVTV